MLVSLQDVELLTWCCSSLYKTFSIGFPGQIRKFVYSQIHFSLHYKFDDFCTLFLSSKLYIFLNPDREKLLYFRNLVLQFSATRFGDFVMP